MKQKLFENVGGNQFKLISENVDANPKTTLVREGLRKIFESANGKPLTYKSLANIGMGYIKDVGEARKCALQEARYIAEAFGYKENANKQAFVKEVDDVSSEEPMVQVPYKHSTDPVTELPPEPSEDEKIPNAIVKVKGMLKTLAALKKCIPSSVNASYPNISYEVEILEMSANQLLKLLGKGQ